MIPAPLLLLSALGCIAEKADTAAEAPLTLSITLSPTAVSTDTVVAAEVNTGGVSGALTYAWTVDGQPVDAGGEALDGALYFDRDQQIALSVDFLADDGREASAGAGPITVANSAPQVTEITLTPQVLFTDDTVAAAVTAADPDGDPVELLYTWLVDDDVIGGVYEPVLDGWAFDKGQSVALRVLPGDGERDGPLVTSEPVVVANSPPQAPDVAVSPAEPATTDTLTCRIGTPPEDPDGDEVSYAIRWTADGIDRSGAARDGAHPGDTVDADQTGEDELWACHVTASDGEDEAPEVSASALVGAPCDQTITVAWLPSWFDWTWADLAWADLSADASAYGCNAIALHTVARGFDEAELAATGATVLLTSWPSAGAVDYSPGELAAVEAALAGGAGLVITGFLDWRSGSSALGLAPLVGVDPEAVFWDYAGHDLPVDLLDPAHPLAADLPPSIGLSSSRLAQRFEGLPSDALDEAASLVMATAGEEEVVIAYEGDWRAVWFTGLPDFQVDNDDSVQALYNAVSWTAGY